MSEQERLYREYKGKLKQLQKSCPHKRVSDWILEFTDAHGVPTGYVVRYCLRCSKTIERKKDDDKVDELLANVLRISKEEAHRFHG